MFFELLGYAVIMLVSGVLCIGLAKVLISYFNISGVQEARSALSFQRAGGRLIAFFTVILPQCAYRIFTTVFGSRGIITTNNTHFITSPAGEKTGIIMVLMISVLMAAALLELWRRQKQSFPVLIGVAFVLFAHYSYFVLPDDTLHMISR